MVFHLLDWHLLIPHLGQHPPAADSHSAAFLGLTSFQAESDLSTVLPTTTDTTVSLYTQPWCTWCQKLLPEWHKAVSEFERLNSNPSHLKVEHVNCDLQRETCDGIGAYPTLLAQHFDAEGHLLGVEAYAGDRSAGSLLEFIQGAAPSAPELTTTQTAA